MLGDGGFTGSRWILTVRESESAIQLRSVSFTVKSPGWAYVCVRTSLPGTVGSSGEPSPKSHQPCEPPDERSWIVTMRPSQSTAKLATGLAGLKTRSSSGDMYIITAPERMPATAPRAVLYQADFFGGSAAGAEADTVAVLMAGPP